MILYGSSGVGEPEYAGAIYSPDLASLELEAPVVELALTYDPAPPMVRAGAIPAWIVLVAGVYIVAKWAGLRIGGA